MSEEADLALATRPSNLNAAPRLIEDITALHGKLEEGGEATRHELVNKVRSLCQALQTPREQMVQHTWADVWTMSFRNWFITLFRQDMR